MYDGRGAFEHGTVIKQTEQMRIKRNLLLVVGGIGVLLLTSFLMIEQILPKSPVCSEIDVVYTWVNGSDPAFVSLLQEYDSRYDPARFDDKNELRYSLRSLEMYAPWVRHVYIVTNGQIPHWLDLSYKRVTVVSHEALSPNPHFLPTFSSAAIETFLHLIPHLSKRFLYMNDDIFLGSSLFPEDLYNSADGVRIYQAWMVPDCAEDCPWTYIGDGACDQHCDIPECQFDGNDCLAEDPSLTESNNNNDIIGKTSNVPQVSPLSQLPDDSNKSNGLILNGSKGEAPVLKYLFRRNMSEASDIKRITDSYKPRLGVKFDDHLPLLSASKDKLPMEKPKSILAVDGLTKDIYSQSLIYTNMLLNRQYGFKARNVLAHVGFLLDRDIVLEMQRLFGKEIVETASHRFRTSDDIQFAFAYYSYVMSETRSVSISEIFDEFDTDSSQSWSDREIRTLLARMHPLPLDQSTVRFFEKVAQNCSKFVSEPHEGYVFYSTLAYERYQDSSMPTITRKLVEKCEPLSKALIANFSPRLKYKYNINPKRTQHSNFMMLTSNVSNVVNDFDKIRRSPRKFICINDNLDPQKKNENVMIRNLLEDFYISFFPHRSSFELLPEYRNRFVNLREYHSWQWRQRTALIIGYGASLVLVVFLFKLVCIRKAKLVRYCVQRL